ncbi:unnamed protein product [Closterium sp. Yama58-4]|nr:unnamed protein product [Closterium sp. Yama58-4]
MAAATTSASFATFSGLRAENVTARPAAVTLPAAASAARPAVVATKKVAKRKQIILTKNVPNVGKAGDLLSVRLGFFRNFLFPQGFAKTATPQILKEIEEEQARIEAEKQKVLEEARKVARQLQTVGGLTVRRKAGSGKSFFGSVSVNDIVDIIKANINREIPKADIELPEIKEVGQYTASIRLHPEVTADVRINVVGK